MIKIIELFPEKLRDSEIYPLFTEVSTMIEAVKDKYHDSVNNSVQNLYSFESDFYSDENLTASDPNRSQLLARENIDKLVDSYLPFIKEIFDFTYPQKRDFLRFSSAMFSMKGTSDSLQLLLRLSGIKVKVYDYSVYSSLPQKSKEELLRRLGIVEEEFSRCSVYVQLDITERPSEDDKESLEKYGILLDDRVQRLVNSFLWVCTNFYITYCKDFEEGQYSKEFGGVEERSFFYKRKSLPNRRLLLYRSRSDFKCQTYKNRIKSLNYTEISDEKINQSIYDYKGVRYYWGKRLGGIKDQVKSSIYGYYSSDLSSAPIFDTSRKFESRVLSGEAEDSYVEVEVPWVKGGRKLDYSRIIFYKRNIPREKVTSKVNIELLDPSLLIRDVLPDSEGSILSSGDTIPLVEEFRRRTKVNSRINIRISE